MYGELTLTLKAPISFDNAAAVLTGIVGVNIMDVGVAIANTPLAALSASVICAEQVPARAVIVYLLIGNDTIVADIFAESTPQIRAQCNRIARQVSAAGLATSTVVASILVSANGTDVDILSGEKVSLFSRWWDAMRDRFIGKFVPALVTVFMVSSLLGQTPALQTAEISLVAALIGAFLDAAVAALVADKWKWKESR